MRLLIISLVTNHSGTNFNAGRKLSAAFHTFLESYIYQDSILA